MRDPRVNVERGLAQSRLDIEVFLCRERPALCPLHSRGRLASAVRACYIGRAFSDCPDHPAWGGGCQACRSATRLSAQPVIPKYQSACTETVRLCLISRVGPLGIV